MRRRAAKNISSVEVDGKLITFDRPVSFYEAQIAAEKAKRERY